MQAHVHFCRILCWKLQRTLIWEIAVGSKRPKDHVDGSMMLITLIVWCRRHLSCSVQDTQSSSILERTLLIFWLFCHLTTNSSALNTTLFLPHSMTFIRLPALERFHTDSIALLSMNSSSSSSMFTHASLRMEEEKLPWHRRNISGQASWVELLCVTHKIDLISSSNWRD